MEYKSTFKSNFGLTIILIFLGLASFAIGVYSRTPALFFFGAVVFCSLLIIRVRFKVLITDKEIVYTDLFSTKRVNLSDVTGACWMSDYGYPRNRGYGPLVYEIRTPEKTLRINLKLFSQECMNNVVNRIKELQIDSVEK